MSTESKIFLVGLFTEGVLFAIWLLFFSFEIITPVNQSYSIANYLLLTILLLIPLLITNYLLFIKYPSQTRENFLDEKVYPLCTKLSFLMTLPISAIAGIGEELFFRDLILNLIYSWFAPEYLTLGLFLALTISSLAFAIVHFIGQIRNSFELIFIYTLVGVYFGLIYFFFQSVVLCILVHAIYDFIALNVYRYEYNKRPV